MNRRASERCAVAALVAVMFYGLACIYPVAWSPDSTRVVFPLSQEAREGPTALIMADLEGHFVCEVASLRPEQGALSPAVWSPDGRLLAYVRYERLEGKGVRASLLLHEAESGSHETIWQGPEVDDVEDLTAPFPGPTWLSDPLRVAVDAMSPGPRALLVLSTTGEAEGTIHLPAGDEEGTWLALSPDGRYLAYAHPVPSDRPDTFAVKVCGTAGGQAKEVCRVRSYGDPPFVTPAWTADSAALYVPVLEVRDQRREFGYVRRCDVASDALSDVWQRPDAQPSSVSLSSDGSVMAVDYLVETRDPEFLATDVVDLDAGIAATVHYSGANTFHLPTTLSPDGRWVAFTQYGAEGAGSVGVLVSADGATLRFYLPDEPGARGLAVEVARTRLMLASRFGSEAEQVKKDLDRRLSEAGLPGLAAANPGELARIRTLANETLAADLSPLAREAFRVHLLAELTDSLAARAGTLSVAEAEAMAAACRAMLADYESDYPAGILLPGLTQRMEEALSALAADAPEETPVLTP